MLRQHRFYLARLDPVAAYLYLIVDASDELDLTLGHVASAVTAAIQPRAWLQPERIRNELVCRQLRLMQVAPCYTGATDAQLTAYSKRHRLGILIEEVRLHVRKWTSDCRR